MRLKRLIPLALALTNPAYGRVLTVSLAGDSDFADIQEALDAANHGDTILVRPGLYELAAPLDFNRLHESGDPGSPPLKDLVARSEAGPESTILRPRPGPAPAAFVIFRSGERSRSQLQGFTFDGAGNPPPAYIHFSGKSFPTILHCWGVNGSGVALTFQDNAAPFLEECRWDNGTMLVLGEARPVLSRCEGGGLLLTESGQIRLLSGHYSGPISCFSSAEASIESCTIRGVRQMSSGSLVLRSTRVELAPPITVGPGSSLFLEDCVVTDIGTGDSEGAILLHPSARAEVHSCTIAGNSLTAFQLSASSSLLVTESIIWSNAGGAFTIAADADLRVEHSCVEGTQGLAGNGNIDDDPLFCGWGAISELHIRPPADGGAAPSPLDDSLAYDLALSSESPCLKAGPTGARIGADTGVCGSPGVSERSIYLPDGTFTTNGKSLAHRASLIGSGIEQTKVTRQIAGLRSVAHLSGLTIDSGLTIARGERPNVENVRLDRVGVLALPGSAPRFVRCEIQRCDLIGIQCKNADPAFVDCQIRNNWYFNNGESPGVTCFGGSPSFLRCIFSRNHSIGQFPGGGAVESRRDCAPHFTDCIFEGNTSDAGGGVSGWNITLQNCKISGSFGGGAFIQGESRMTNCIVSANSPSSHVSKKVSGIDAWDQSVISFCTISDNSIGRESAAVRLHGEARLESSIVWGNFGPSLELEEGTVARSVVEGDTPPPGDNNSNQDPRFVARAVVDFGPEKLLLPPIVTQEGDYALQADSAALDLAGSLLAPPSDAVGRPRFCGRAPDAGAFESGNCSSALFVRGDANNDNKVDLSDAVFVINYLFEGGREPECVDAADFDDDGRVSLADPARMVGYLFMGSDPPPAPFPLCGEDLTLDPNACAAFTACQ